MLYKSMGGGGDEMKAFRELQSHLAPRWALADGDGPEPRDIVVVPSLSFDGIDTVSIDGVIHYEERMLFALNLLRHPRARLVYVTSAPIHPAAVDYMLSLISGIPNEHMRRRLTVLSLYDSSLVPLTQEDPAAASGHRAHSAFDSARVRPDDLLHGN